jgi:hypothetical protein
MPSIFSLQIAILTDAVTCSFKNPDLCQPGFIQIQDVSKQVEIPFAYPGMRENSMEQDRMVAQGVQK